MLLVWTSRTIDDIHSFGLNLKFFVTFNILGTYDLLQLCNLFCC